MILYSFMYRFCSGDQSRCTFCTKMYAFAVRQICIYALQERAITSIDNTEADSQPYSPLNRYRRHASEQVWPVLDGDLQ